MSLKSDNFDISEFDSCATSVQIDKFYEKLDEYNDFKNHCTDPNCSFHKEYELPIYALYCIECGSESTLLCSLEDE